MPAGSANSPCNERDTTTVRTSLSVGPPLPVETTRSVTLFVSPPPFVTMSVMLTVVGAMSVMLTVVGAAKVRENVGVVATVLPLGPLQFHAAIAPSSCVTESSSRQVVRSRFLHRMHQDVDHRIGGDVGVGRRGAGGAAVAALAHVPPRSVQRRAGRCTCNCCTMRKTATQSRHRGSYGPA